MILSVFDFKVFTFMAIYISARNFWEMILFWGKPYKILKCTVWAKCRMFYGTLTLDTLYDTMSIRLAKVTILLSFRV